MGSLPRLKANKRFDLKAFYTLTLVSWQTSRALSTI